MRTRSGTPTTESSARRLRPRLSIVTPALDEEASLPALAARLRPVLDGLGFPWEWIIVDDGSADGTFRAIERLAEEDGRVRGVRLARNVGSHAALMCGLGRARGDAAVALAADLEDPPEIIPRLVAAWTGDAHVVWAVRRQRRDVGAARRLASRAFHRLIGRMVGSAQAIDADCMLLDRTAIALVRRTRERHVNLFALLLWSGLAARTVEYDRDARAQGRSGWTWAKLLELVVDSVVGWSYAPIRVMSYVGLLTATAGFVYAAIVVAAARAGRPPAGWASLMVMVLVIGGVQMAMLGVLGEYLWRALEQARGRPRYVIERTTRRRAAGATGEPEHDDPPLRRVAGPTG